MRFQVRAYQFAAALLMCSAIGFSQSGNAQTVYKAINFGGGDLSVDGVSFKSPANSSATSTGKAFSNTTVPLTPSVSAAKGQMLSSSVYDSAGLKVRVDSVPNGNYRVYLYTWEDNSNLTYSVSLEGKTVVANQNSGSAGSWMKLGPYEISISDGALDLSASAVAFNLSGMEIYQLTTTPNPSPAPSPTPTPSGVFRAQYFNSLNFTSPAVSRDEVNIDMNPGSGSPVSGVGADNFSVLWEGSFTFAAGTYRFSATADDGVKLYIDGALVIDKWVDQGPTTYNVDRTLTAGSHVIRMEYYEKSGGAVAKLVYSAVNAPTPIQPTSSRPSTLILTDIAGDPDDEQSMVRLLLYANDLDIKGLIATRHGIGDNAANGYVVDKNRILEMIGAYELDLPNLRLHDSRYPSGSYLRSITKGGTIDGNVGADNEASDHIYNVIKNAMDTNAQPVWIQIWGGPRELAQALRKAKLSLSASDYTRFKSKIRAYFIAFQYEPT